MTAKDLLEKMDIRDTLFFNGEWQNGGLSTIMESYYGERKKELEKDMEEFAEWIGNNKYYVPFYNPMSESIVWAKTGTHDDYITTTQLREMWEATRDKASQDKVDFLKSAKQPNPITHPYDLSKK